MIVILIRKLLRDIWLPLLVVAVLLCAFECLWARVTQRISRDLLPQLSEYILNRPQQFGTIQIRPGALIKKEEAQKIARDVQKMVFQGPGKIVQSLIGGESLDLMRAQDTLSIGFVHPLVQVILCIWAIGRAAGAITGEIDRGTMELLLAQPVSRRDLVLAHLGIDALTIPVLCLSLWGGVWLGTWLAGLHGQTDETMSIDPLAFGPALLSVGALVFAASGCTMFFSSLGRFRGRVLGAAVLFFLIQFLVNLIGQIWDEVQFLRPCTVFYYYQPQFIILHPDWASTGQVWLCLAVLLALGATGYALALVCFCRRDVPAPL
jgi:ABC-2 type transport system permease protein